MTTTPVSTTGPQLRIKLTNLVDNTDYCLTVDDARSDHLLEQLLDRLTDIADSLPEPTVNTGLDAGQESDVWYDACECCAGPYTYGPSRSPLCGICAEMESGLPDEEFEPRRVRVVKDLSNSPCAGAVGLPWIAYCPCCPWFAPFTAHEYALHEALMHIARRHYIHPDTGREVPW
jgi:hypothetical protein